MEAFQKIVLFSAIIILILALVLMGITLSSGSSADWPPVVPECPDWWVAKKSGSNSVCVNTRDLGTCATPSNGAEHQIMNFNTSTFTGTNGMCAKYNWANKCNVAWDGITYGVANPCESETT